MRIPRPHRYGPLARYYDTLSGERLYVHGRIAAVEMLRLRQGDRVLDIGCGTGLNFAPLLEAVGPAGALVGLDASPEMLARAQQRVDSHGWAHVQLVAADAGCLADHLDGHFDAVLFTYSLSIIGRWRASWDQALALTRAGGRVAIVDTARPAGRWAALTPLAWVVMAIGGVHPSRRVWQLVNGDTYDTEHRSLCGGHVRVAAGTVPTAGPGGPR